MLQLCRRWLLKYRDAVNASQAESGASLRVTLTTVKNPRWLTLIVLQRWMY